MGRLLKPVFISFSLATLSALAILPACRSASEKSEEKNVFDKKAQEINAQAKSFNDTQKALLEANARGAKGCEKLDIMWNKIIETQQTEADMMAPKGKPAEIIAFGNGSAERFWRIFEGFKPSEGGSEIRPYEQFSKKYVRLTHRYASLAKMKFVVNKDVVSKLGYTGQYAEGNDCVLARMSSAVPTGKEDRFTPAVAAKFFLDGDSESQVLIAQHDIGGQSSGTDFTKNPPVAKKIDNNFYTHYLSNRLSFEKGVLSGVGAFSRFFHSAQYFAKDVFKLNYIIDPRELLATHLAERSPNGTIVPKSAVKGPRFIWMGAPSPEMKAEFGAMAAKDLDFRKHFFSLNSRGNGIPMFNIYASDTWTYTPEKDATLIGQLITNSPFVVSEAADQRLFFKHAVQWRPMPDESKGNPYHQDYPFAEWNDKLFTEDCRLGVKAKEIHPKDKEDLNGTFIRDAALNPFTLRKNKDGKPCLIDIIDGKEEETAAEQLGQQLP